MGSGRLTYEGRIFEFNYKDPATAAVDAKAAELQNEQPWKTLAECRSTAYAFVEGESRRRAQQKAERALLKYIKQCETAKAEVGIAQRRKFVVDVKEATGGLIEREIQTVNTSSDPRVILPETMQAMPGKMVTELNKILFTAHSARTKRLNNGTGLGKYAWNNKVDLAIPVPNKAYLHTDQMHDLAILFSGGGQADAQLALEMSRLNRFHKSYLPQVRELSGYTFITRPHLNLSQSNLAAVRSFAPLLYADNQSLQMAIKHTLDTEIGGPWGSQDFSQLQTCPFMDYRNPFNVMCCNALESINGFPDPNLSIETTEGGFFSEQQSAVIGYDRLAHGADLQLQFRDYVGGPVLALHDYWTQYMGMVATGEMSQYMSDIADNLMGYTVSIYRFIMDPTGRFIQRWAKATGCYPKMAPVGAPFNQNQGEQVVQATREFSVPYQAHHFGYNDPIILKEFNLLVERYCAGIEKLSTESELNPTLLNNRAGIPYIVQTNGRNELVWKFMPQYHSEREKIYNPVP